MKSIPLKKTRSIDLAGAILQRVGQGSDPDGANAIKLFAGRFDTLRKDITLIGTSGLTIEHSISSLKNYLTVVNILYDAFDDNGLSIQFPWTDSLRPQRFQEQNSLQWEQCCVIYNLAALLSFAGCAEKRETVEGIRAAIKYLQEAAGILTALRDDMMPSYVAPTTRDLRDPVLSMHITLLLAQAQLCFYERAAGEKMGRSVLAKLAYGTSVLYHTAYELSKRVTDGYIESETVAWLKLQTLCYKAAAQYQRSMSEKSKVEELSSGYGGLISRLQDAKENLLEATELKNQYALPTDFSDLQTKVSEWLAELVRDNKIIYVEVVPDVSSLPALESAVSVKSTPVDLKSIGPPNEAAAAAFLCIVPQEVHSLLKQFTSRYQSQLSRYYERARMVYDKIDSVSKPPADASDEGIDDLWSTISAIQLKGGVVTLERIVDGLRNSSVVAYAELEEIARHIKDKATSSSDAFTRQMDAWVTELHSKLQAADEANSRITLKLDRGRKMFYFMQSPSKRLIEAEIPKQSNGDLDDKGPLALMRQLDQEIHRSRAELVDTLQKIASEEQIHNISLRAELRAEFKRSNLDLQDILDKKLDTLDTQNVTRVDSAIVKIDQKLQELNKLMKESTAASSLPTDERSQFLQELRTAVKIVDVAFLEAAEGTNFFSALQQRIQEIRNKVESSARLGSKNSTRDGGNQWVYAHATVWPSFPSSFY